MTETATSPRYHPRPAAPARTPAAHTSTNMPPYFSTPRLSTPHQTPHTNAKSPSPNYFGFQANENGAFLSDSPQHTKQNWSPPSSAVRSTAAASPSILPVDQNPDFDAFRRQSEGKAFNLGGLGGNFKMAAPPGRSKHERTNSKTAPAPAKDVVKAATQPRDMPPSRARGSLSKDTLDPSIAELSRSPKRVLSPGSAAQLEPTRKGSPANFHGDVERPQSAQNQPRFKLPLDNPMSYSKVQRSETLPETRGGTEQQMVTPQHVATLMDSKMEDILILDLRVSTQYAKSHIAGSLNLCIPTTLLKRLSFNVQKLAETFKDDEQRAKFEAWRNSSYIIVYDAASAQLKDAQICINTVKKFQSEGYEGTLHIMKGGFAEFSRSFSHYTEAGFDASESGQQHAGSSEGGPEIAPVIGGCPMPFTNNPANPFFGNIRQNMDLIGGVGQIPLKHPQTATKSTEAEKFPDWLQNAADEKDQGKKVSTKFEAIERREKKRMEDALSGKVSYSSAASSPKPRRDTKDKSVQIAGIEKGNKNRYNNIWPFEHSRVRLQGVPKTGCDYFNANHIRAAWSNKRYISTQAPIPATFNVSPNRALHS